MADNHAGTTAGRPFTAMATAITDALIEEKEAGKGINRSIEMQSQLTTEASACSHSTSAHFLRELPKHCSMLTFAIHDSCRALEIIDRSMPFSATVIVRGLMEAAADLYWLADTRIERIERIRRTFLVFLIQVETQVRQLEQYRDRRRPEEQYPEGNLSGKNLDKAISEGWQYLAETAKNMAAAGYRLHKSNRPGAKFILGERKPPINKLVDAMMTDLKGSATSLNLYSLYSSTAHVEGEGLGSLRDLTDMVNTEQGAKYAYSYSEDQWKTNIIAPGIQAAMGSVRMWVKLGYPGRLREFDRKLEEITQEVNR